MKTLKRFFDDIHRLANAVNANFRSSSISRMQEMLVVLSQEDRNLLKEWRRNGPRVKKETT